MFPWWQSLESVAVFNFWMQLIAMIGASLTGVSTLFLWMTGSRMTRYILEREQSASQKMKAVEKAAEQIRKELLATQQNQDIADQRRRLAEMDAGALRKEMEQTRSRYAHAEGTLKERIKELKDMNITQGGSATTRPVEVEKKKGVLDSQQCGMLNKLLSSGPKGEIDILSVLDDPLSHETALEIKKIFDAQGWSSPEIVQSAFSQPPEGFVLIIHSKQTAPSYAKFLQRTLTTTGLPVSAQINSKYREWSISLLVGQFS